MTSRELLGPAKWRVLMCLTAILILGSLIGWGLIGVLIAALLDFNPYIGLAIGFVILALLVTLLYALMERWLPRGEESPAKEEFDTDEYMRRSGVVADKEKFWQDFEEQDDKEES
jgi:membrane protein implicated in regulation of membrane protease activity